MRLPISTAPRVVEVLPDDLVVGIPRAAGLAVELAPARESVHPLVEGVAAVAQRLFDGPVRAGDEAVERHRDVERQSCHRNSLALVVVQVRRSRAKGLTGASMFLTSRTAMRR